MALENAFHNIQKVDMDSFSYSQEPNATQRSTTEIVLIGMRSKECNNKNDDDDSDGNTTTRFCFLT